MLNFASTSLLTRKQNSPVFTTNQNKVKGINDLRDWVFRQVHTKNLVYNTCWEDPRCDRQLLQLQADSEMVMITSAGCNALDYLLDNPKKINCIDMNPRQNALLELKKACLSQLSFAELWAMFGNGILRDMERVYQEKLRSVLPEFAREYWDIHWRYFNGKGIRRSFYHYGTSGTLAWIFNKYLRNRRKLYRKIQGIFNAKTLEDQTRMYDLVEPKISNKLVEFVVNRHLTMCMLGVPRSQQLLFATKYKRGALGFIQECLRKVFTQIPTQDNYFYRLYLDGRYSKNCCPAYLEEQNFQCLGERIDQIQTHTSTISDFLIKNPGQYSHYVLLDHQDWLAANNIPALEEEWELILKNSRPGTKILLRSAAHEIDFFPKFVLDAVEFEQDLTIKTHQEDRVGTYASVYLAIVK
jgi:S-adenosylmethionine-diacylglycerol 3-amino-3-carboxypropyl transferase